jgi:gliding motility-associated-like protein
LALTDTGSIPVRLIISDLNNCRDTVQSVFTISDVGTIPRFGPAPQFACVGDLVSFSDSSLFGPSNRIVRWEWNFGTGSDSVFLSPPFGARYTRPGVYDVTLTIQDSLGCRYTVSRPGAVVVRETVADFTTNDTAVCARYPIQFTNRSIGADSTTALLTYLWDFGNGTTSTETNPVIAYADTGYFTVRLIATDPFGCVDTLERRAYIRVGNARADFLMSDTFSTCPPLVVRFTNLSQDAIRTTWDFGNGNFSSFPNPAHTYTTPGSFFVKLVAEGYTGCRDSMIRQVLIRGPIGTFSYSPLIGCPPLQVRFNSNTQSSNLFTWDFSDGESIVVAQDTAVHIYNIPGNYVPRLILDDGLGCRVPLQGRDTIRILGARAFIRSLAQNSFCDSAIVSFFDSSVVNDVVTRVRWRFGDGTESDLRNPVHVYRQPGRYLVTLEVFTQNNCYSSDTLQVPVIIARTPQFVIRDSGLNCVPDTVQFSGVWQNPDTSQIRYRWDLGNGQTTTLALPPAIRYALPGTFLIRLETTNEYGCTSTDTLPYVVNDTPRVQARPNAFICAGSGIALVAIGATTYRWDSDPSLSCTNCASPTATPPIDRTYRVVGTDANGCQASDTLLLQVKQRGNLSVGQGDTLCAGEPFQLRAQGFERYQWIPATYLNNPTIANPVARPLLSTNYRVIASDTLGCFSDSGLVPLVVYQIPLIDISESLIRASLGTVVPLRTVASSDVVSWNWTPGSGLTCDRCPEPLVTVSRKQVYTVTARNDGDCVATDNVTIEPYCSAEDVFVPNTFSPNGDGRNDRFYPMGRGITTVRSLQIFNRWGELVFERRSFGLNDSSAGWDGTYKGRRLSPDVYVYTMELLCASNELFTLKGNVTLIQ